MFNYLLKTKTLCQATQVKVGYMNDFKITVSSDSSYHHFLNKKVHLKMIKNSNKNTSN
jgi:hypothetical protein